MVLLTSTSKDPVTPTHRSI